MRQYAWYSPEYNWIVLQTIFDECRIIFEWDFQDMCEARSFFGEIDSPMTQTTWIPLGEL